MRKVQPMHDRILVRYLDDPEYEDSRVIALIKQDSSLAHQAGVDPIGELGDYRRVMRRAQVIATGPGRVDEDGREPVEVKPGQVVYCAAWDDAEGRFPGHAMIRQADIALIER
jgi:co-chaperonin GroES (HSP10)